MSRPIDPVKLSGQSRKVLEAIAETIVPSEGPERPGAPEMKLADRLEAFVDQFPGARLLLLLVCWLWEFSPTWSGSFRRFSSLSLAERTQVLESWEKSRWFFRRAALTGLKAVFLASFYNNPDLWPYLGYQEGCLSEPPRRGET